MNEKEISQEESGGAGAPSRFERDLQCLEEIVAQLEQGNLPLDRAMQLYEDGVAAYKRCRRLLRKAEIRVVKLVQTLEGELEEEGMELPDNGEDAE